MAHSVGSNRATQGARSEQANQYGSNKVVEFTGIAAEDKQINSKQLKILVKDLTPFYKGKLEPKTQEVPINVKNYTGTLKLTNTITATWYGQNSNRLYPPDVKKGEQVKVYLYSDQDTYYWDSAGRDDDKRRTERQTIAVANTPESPTPVTPENSYQINLDTQEEKCIDIRTSNTGGEEHRYQIRVDAKNSTLGIWDDDNNEIKIESKIPRVYMKNKEGVLVELSKKNLTMIVPEDLLIKVGRQLIYDVPAISMINTSGGGATVWDANDVVFKTKSFNVSSPKIGLVGAVEAQSIVSGSHYATSYGTISAGRGRSGRSAFTPSASSGGIAGGRSNFNTYGLASINKANGAVTPGTGSPNTTGGGGANRHCTAWEDFMTTISLICEDLKKIDAVTGYGENTAGIMAAAQAAIMNLNKGE